MQEGEIHITKISNIKIFYNSMDELMLFLKCFKREDLIAVANTVEEKSSERRYL